jgi:hypothetical protein
LASVHLLELSKKRGSWGAIVRDPSYRNGAFDANLIALHMYLDARTLSS